MSAVAELRRYFTETKRWLLVPVLLLAILPLVTEQYFLSIATQAIILGLFAISVDIALGYVGLFTLAPAAFFGIGAYSVAKLVVDYGSSYWLGFPAAIVLAVVIAVLIGYGPIKRRIGLVYFVLFTLAFGVLVHDFTYATTWLTGGSNGLGYLTAPTLFGIDLSRTVPYYYFALLAVVVVAGLLYWLLSSDYGDVLHATRQNEVRMRYLGYDTDREKLIAWVLSATVSSIAGALYVATVNVASPSLMAFSLTGEVTIWVVIGGLGTFFGPFLAAFGLTIFESYLGAVLPEGYLLILGALFIVFVFVLPDGLVGLLQRWRDGE
ncbi:ABC-type branched-subunit amino acid transport system permease subunit [Halarchaeum rubridurum]|uniref:ABC-type branched-subunit amino acid transport system permease subunit n=1 Tax=Halarchaeum rubridurum TaxID=489911 RepID=A0A830FYT0_9EURY|nr:branched-chain amino acid ABC transporter permease [Halarchaeum rubridurum]MBP1954504.1 ABC-type branched-subunit amino acid transport system permease subunit [Halarchaeum rubridurum]GGM61626.1 branched-chain amino acid ABC transporter permease [Halarchaeum rubridurum]